MSSVDFFLFFLVDSPLISSGETQTAVTPFVYLWAHRSASASQTLFTMASVQHCNLTIIVTTTPPPQPRPLPILPISCFVFEFWFGLVWLVWKGGGSVWGILFVFLKLVRCFSFTLCWCRFVSPFWGWVIGREFATGKE